MHDRSAEERPEAQDWWVVALDWWVVAPVSQAVPHSAANYSQEANCWPILLSLSHSRPR